MSYVKNLRGVFAGPLGWSRPREVLIDVLVADVKSRKQITVLIDHDSTDRDVYLGLVERAAGLDARRAHDFQQEQKPEIGPIFVVHSYDDAAELIPRINCAAQHQPDMKFALYVNAPCATNVATVSNKPFIRFSYDSWNELAELADRVYITSKLL